MRQQIQKTIDYWACEQLAILYDSATSTNKLCDWMTPDYVLTANDLETKIMYIV
jgi:hypothetical protein